MSTPEVTYHEPRILAALIRGVWWPMDEPLTHQVLDELDQDGYTTVEASDGSGAVGHDSIGGWHRALNQAQGRRTRQIIVEGGNAYRLGEPGHLEGAAVLADGTVENSWFDIDSWCLGDEDYEQLANVYDRLGGE